jgi:hypothetical protein
MPNVPAFFLHAGVKLNSIALEFTRSGPAAATISAIASPGRIDGIGRRRMPRSSGLRRGAGSAGPATRSPPRSASRRPRSAASYGVWGSTSSARWNRSSRRGAEPVLGRPAADPGEREHPGELIHIDIKKLGRIDGAGHHIRACPRAGPRIRPRRPEDELAGPVGQPQRPEQPACPGGRARLGVRPCRRRRCFPRCFSSRCCRMRR